jgi:C4-dicarboxylate transporter/malic acid transport protein
MTTTPTIPAPSPGLALGQRTRELHPGWFASVMGTGILAVTTYNNPGGWVGLAGLAHAIGVGLAVITYLLAVILLVGNAVRWIAHTNAAVADFRHPMKGAMYATLPGGLLVAAVMTSVVSPSLFSPLLATWIIAILAIVGGCLALVMGIAFAVTLFTGQPPAESVNGGWFIPPVVTIIIPMALAPLASKADATTAGLLIVVSYAFYGMGFLLFLLTLGLVYDRLVLHPLPPAPLAPTLWIGLGPIGVSVLVPLTLAKIGAGLWADVAPAVSLVTRLASTAVWGFGVWWLALAIVLLVRFARRGGVPFHLGWWAFVFPLGAFTAATTALARSWQSPALEAVAGVLYVGLLTAWIVVGIRTLAGIRSGRIWSS